MAVVRARARGHAVYPHLQPAQGQVRNSHDVDLSHTLSLTHSCTRTLRSNEKLLWGEELEYPILKVDRNAKTVKLSLRGEEVLETLRAREEQSGRSDNRKEASAWHPEYGSWMLCVCVGVGVGVCLCVY